MDYEALAREFMESMSLLRNANPHKQIQESMHGETFVLQYISIHGGSVLPSEISNIMGISTARIAATLNSLEQKGLITRRIDTEDRRRILVDLTSDGKKQAGNHRETILQNTIQLLSLMGEEDAKEYVRLTRKLAENAAAQRREAN